MRFDGFQIWTSNLIRPKRHVLALALSASNCVSPNFSLVFTIMKDFDAVISLPTSSNCEVLQQTADILQRPDRAGEV